MMIGGAGFEVVNIGINKPVENYLKAPLNEAFANFIGADAYCRDASVVVESVKAFIARRRRVAS
jgi:methanogenic corrinoid protein MtbC1